MEVPRVSGYKNGTLHTDHSIQTDRITAAWPRYRYDAGNTAWNADSQPSRQQPLHAWQYKLCSNTVTAPVVANNRIFVGTPSGLLALHAVTGKRQWQSDEGPMKSPPTVANGTVYVVSTSLQAFDAVTGKRQWKFDLKTDSPIATSPVIVTGLVYAGGTAQTPLYALDATDGTLVWKHDVTSPRPSAPAVLDEPVYAIDGNRLLALDAATGTRQWDAFVDEETQFIPTVTDRRAYVGAAHGIVGFDIARQSRLWETTVTSTQLAVDDSLFYVPVEKTLWAFEKDTGYLAWNRDVLPGDASSGTFTTCIGGGETIFCGSSHGNIVALDVESAGKSNAVKWRFDLSSEDGGGAIVDLAVTKNVLYATTVRGEIHALVV
ncbi:PQQ-binding-like beta-propeller repeat protein [Haladaptatus sp. W1]|uniref:outer membrane protein assembly factor BamB family protein n=2 Tax=Haladaptatus sp. W1 TaxID=1897478 RepID=UPI00373FD624